MSDGGMSQTDFLFLIAVLATAGSAVSGYLTWQWYQESTADWCDVNSYFSCSRVRDSPYAHIGPVPTAAVGLAGFLVLLALAVIVLRGVNRLGPWPPERWLLAFAIVGALIGATLTVVEVLVIEAVCILCAIGFALDLGILGLAVLLVRVPSRI